MVDPDRAARIEALRVRGMERYAVDDLRGAAACWRQASELIPDDIQLRGYLDWAEWRLQKASAEILPRHLDRVPDSVFTADTVDPIAVFADLLDPPAIDADGGETTAPGPEPRDPGLDVEARVRRFL